MTKPTKWLGAQRRGRSAWESAQSDQPSLSVWRNLGSLATHWVHSDGSDQTGRIPRLIWVFAECSHFVGFVTRRLMFFFSQAHIYWSSNFFNCSIFEPQHDKTNKMTCVARQVFVAYWIRKSEVFAWDRNSYLTHVISPQKEIFHVYFIALVV